MIFRFIDTEHDMLTPRKPNQIISTILCFSILSILHKTTWLHNFSQALYLVS